jgi:hypothetical protein
MIFDEEVRKLIRELRFNLVRFEEDDEEEALEALYDAFNIISDIASIVDPPTTLEVVPDPAAVS